MDSTVRVRFAPSPTGEMHIGSARTALFNYLFAKRHGGEFLLRIEDTDQARLVPGSDQRIQDTLKWLGLPWDGEVVYQSKRLERYQDAAEQLIATGHAYRCYCTPGRLTKLREEQERGHQAPGYDRHCRDLNVEQHAAAATENPKPVVRLKVPLDGSIEFEDVIRGKVKVNWSEVDDQVLLKADGFPTYHLANVVDDHDSGITHVIRAEEWLPSTPKHILLYQAFDWNPPTFAHIPLILNENRTKMSKRRDGEWVWVETYRKLGYLPQAFVNYLALLGWNPGTEQELFSLDELTQQFDLERVHKAGAIFSREKLGWINAEWIRRVMQHAPPAAPLRQGGLGEFGIRSSEEEYGNLLDLVQQHYAGKLFTPDQLLTLYGSRAEHIAQIAEQAKLLEEIADYEPALLIFKKSDAAKTKAGLQLALAVLQSLGAGGWGSVEALLNALTQAQQGSELTPGDIFWPVRVALSGQSASPPPEQLLWALGRMESLKRINTALERLK